MTALSFFLLTFSGNAGTNHLIATVQQIEASLDARVGIAVYDKETNQNWQYYADDRFPMNSTFKTLACAALLARVDSGQEQLERIVIFDESELVTYSPVTETRVGAPGMPLDELCEASMSMSDNSAANFILEAIGSPEVLLSINTVFVRVKISEQQTNSPLEPTNPNVSRNLTPVGVRGSTQSLCRKIESSMKTILLGNAGAGKSTLARKLICKDSSVACLSLDELAFAKGSDRRPLRESIVQAKKFIETNENWIIEGCYADIIESLLPYCEELIFLNPGVETCIAHCKQRPWEPEKFESNEAQEANLQNLIEWVSSYENRQDEYGLHRHRTLFDSFSGQKHEFNQPSAYELA